MVAIWPTPEISNRNTKSISATFRQPRGFGEQHAGWGKPAQRKCVMSDLKFLTTDEVSERYRGAVTVGTLENWRALRIGPPFVKIGKAVLYPVEELDAWDQKNLVPCQSSKVVGRARIEGD